ncbi:Transcriptional activator flo8 [Tulasnella sp. 427]|nr:Transcriptional activator flo8 [Tulasnella sp. 427]
MQPSTSVSGVSNGSNGGSPSMQAQHSGRVMNNWEGDRMLHVYMIDYCRKRGFTGVVNALCAQTGNTQDVKAPIDAPQGLLFEWWVVFWDIFTAKSEDDPKKNAVAYIQDQRAKNFRPMHPTDVKPPLGMQLPGPGFNGPHPPPPSSTMMGAATFHGHPPGHPAQQTPGMQPMPAPNGVLPPGQQPPPGAPTPVPPMAQHANGPQPYPPLPQSQQPPHPNAANGPPNQGPGGPQTINMANRPGAPGGPQMALGAQRGAMGSGMPNGQAPHQPFAGSPLGGPAGGGPHPSPRTSQMGPPQGIRNHPPPPQQGQHPQQQGGPANAPTPGGSGLVNGVGSNQTPLMAAQQFMSAGRPSSRSGTPGSQGGGGGQPGIGMSPSRAGGPMQPGNLARPGSQMGGPQQPGAQGSPYPGTLQASPAMLDAALRALGYSKPHESLSMEEKNNVHNWLRNSMQAQAQRQSGMGTPRITSSGNPMAPGNNQPGPPGPPVGMPGTNFQHPQQQFPQPPHTMGQPGQVMKRPGSPSMQMETSANESSPPERKRLRKDDQNGSTPTPMSAFIPGAPGANGMPGQPMPNGLGNPAMMRPTPGAPGNPAQTMNPMAMNGIPQAVGVNPMQMRGPQQTGPQRFSAPLQNKPGGLMPNPVGPGLPIHMKPEPGNMDPQHPATNLVARGPQPKVHPSPSIPNAKASGSMPPPSHTPNPSQAMNKAAVKEESMDGQAKASPGTKPSMQNPSTPVTNPATPANPHNLNFNAGIFNSTIAPSPSPAAILASQQANMNQSTPPINGSRPGSTANVQTTAAPNAGGFNFPGSDMYQISDLNILGDYTFNPGLRGDEFPMDDLLSQFLTSSGMGDDDMAAAAGGSS